MSRGSLGRRVKKEPVTLASQEASSVSSEDELIADVNGAYDIKINQFDVATPEFNITNMDAMNLRGTFSKKNSINNNISSVYSSAGAQLLGVKVIRKYFFFLLYFRFLTVTLCYQTIPSTISLTLTYDGSVSTCPTDGTLCPYTISWSCNPGSYSSTQSNCYFTVVVSSNEAWELTTDFYDSSYTNVVGTYAAWNKAAQPGEANVYGPALVTDMYTCSSNNRLNFRVYCFAAHCTVKYGIQVQWAVDSCGIMWQSGSSYCTEDCTRSQTKSCVYSKINNARASDSEICYEAIGPDIRYTNPNPYPKCSDGEHCGTSNSVCIGGTCTAPTAAPTTFNPSQWSCERSVPSNEGIATVCQNGNNNGSSLTCLPGLTNIIGMGYDVTYGTEMYAAGHALKNRVYDFSMLSSSSFNNKAKINNRLYSAPPSDELRVVANDVTTVHETDISTFYDQVKAYSLALSKFFKLPSSTAAHPPISKSPNDMTSTLTNAAGIRTGLAASISTAVQQQKNVFSSVATISKATYTMQTTASGGGKLCTAGLWNDLADLPSVYNLQKYLTFVSNYGTHIVTAADIGGYVKVDTSHCSNTQSSSESISGYVDIMGQWTIDSSASVTTYETVQISRSSSTVCGGHSAIYFATPAPGTTPWDVWSPTIMDPDYATCAINLELVPIYVLGNTYQKHVNLERAIADYVEQAKNSGGLSSSSFTCEISSGSDSNGFRNVFPAVLMCCLCFFFLFK
jgi:hypothetical protein